MEFEDIEAKYSQKLEAAEKTFYENKKNKSLDRKKIEQEYIAAIRSAREEYYSLMKKKIAQKPPVAAKKKKVLEKTKPLQIQSGNYGPTKFQSTKMKLGLTWFKIRFKLHNTIKAHTPESVSYGYYKTKLMLKRASNHISNIFSAAVESVKNTSKKWFDAIKELSKKVYEKLAALPEKIINKFVKKKKTDAEKKEASSPKDSSSQSEKSESDSSKEKT